MRTVSFGDCECIDERPTAIQVIIDGVARWMPQKIVHDDSEVWKRGDRGTLVVMEWFAIQEGWV